LEAGLFHFVRIKPYSKFLIRSQSQRGQGMTEYIIIVALVAVAAIGVYQYLGQVLRAQTAAIAKELAGEDGAEMTRQAQSASQSAVTQAASKSLKSFAGQANGGQ
jgi:Flp pilus assembly pilin Flp